MPFARRHLVIILLLIGLAGCATTPVNKTNNSALSDKLENKTSAVIVGEFIPRGNIAHAYLTIKNLNTGKTLPIRLDSSTITSYEVPPGRYMIVDGKLSARKSTFKSNLPFPVDWFEPFDVGAGEIVNIGALGYNTLSIKWNSTILFIFPNRDPSEKDFSIYYSYYVSPIDQSEVDAFVSSKFPTLTGRLVNRELKVLISNSDLKQMMNEAAAARNADGTRLSLEEIREHINSAVEIYLESNRSKTR